MGTLYYPDMKDEPGEFSSALAIGDSWFWYPNQNVMETLTRSKAVSADHARVRLLGFGGALLRDYVEPGKFAADVAHWLSPNFGEGFSEFYISGAGNDAVDYHLALKADCTGLSKSVDCIDPQGIDSLLRQTSAALGTLIHNLRWAYRNSTLRRPIFVHGYDYPVPDNRGFDGGIVSSGPWLAPAMNKRGVAPDSGLRFGIMKILIDRLNEEVLAPFDLPGNEIVHIDSRGTLSHDPATYRLDWANELHPTSVGFDKIFNTHWLPALRKYGIAT